jgi:cytochrome c oxidase assembly protein Cox11
LTSQNKKAGRTALKLALIIPVMFAFAVIVMPPLYDVACKFLGINGKALTPVHRKQ